MSRTSVVTTQTYDELIRGCVERRLPAVLTYRVPEGWRTFKCCFERYVERSGTIFLSWPVSPLDSNLEPPPEGATVGLTFRIGHKKCMFSSVRLQDPSSDRLFAIRWPKEIHQLQRRAYQRVSPPRGPVIAVRMWRTQPSQSDAGIERESWYGELEDISAGGIRVNAPASADVRVGETIECLFAPKPGMQPILTEITLRHKEAAVAGRTSLGFQFIGLETTEEGRETLAKLSTIVSQYQRAEQKSKR
jgi:c-di-GMP-binding flagellar brake protein YcgR